MIDGDKGESQALKGRSIWLWLIAGILAVLLGVLRSADNTSVSLPIDSPAVLQTNGPLRIFDRSSNGRDVLLSKTSAGDLWLRDAIGRERCLASNVVRASFSPDGTKFAYGTRDNEILIVTLEGNQLAHLMRASDHVWSANSAALTFSATASLDYPEFEQSVVYYLTTNPAPSRPTGN